MLIAKPAQDGMQSRPDLHVFVFVLLLIRTQHSIFESLLGAHFPCIGSWLFHHSEAYKKYVGSVVVSGAKLENS